MSPLAKVTAGILSLMLLTDFTDPIRAKIYELVRAVDYIVVEPSSNAYRPGSYVGRVNYNPAEPLVTATHLTFLCEPPFSTDLISDKPASRPVNQDLLGLLRNSRIELDRDFVSRTLRMPIVARYASVSVRVLDQWLHEYSDGPLSAIHAKLGPVCRSNIATGAAKGNAYQIRGVYEFRLQFEAAYPAETHDDAKKKMQVELRRIGTTVAENGQEIIRGQASVYGIAWVKI
jgi:hypothetical protein